MAVTFLWGTGAETTVVPPTHAVGDWLYLAVECSSGAVATPAGYSIAPGLPVTHNGGSTVLSVFRQYCTSSSMGNVTLSGGTNHMWGVIVRVRGADITEPQMTEGASPGTGASVNGYMPSVFTREDGAKILGILAYSIDNAGPIASSPTNSTLTGVTEEYDAGTVTNDGGGLVAISGDKSSAGFVAPTTCTLTSTSFCSATIAFRPAAATPYTFGGTVTIDGLPAANGTTVDVLDTVTGKIVGTATIAGGAGAYSLPVAFNTANRYRGIYDDGSSYGASPKATAV